MGLFSIGVFATSILFLTYQYWRRRWPSTANRTLSHGAASSHSPGDTKTAPNGSVKGSHTSHEVTTKEQTAPPIELASDEDASTPKARPKETSHEDVPTFSLTSNVDSEPGPSLSNGPTVPASAGGNLSSVSQPSQQKKRANVTPMAPPPPPSASLMPPPPVKPASLRPLPKPAGGSLQPPPSAASLLRGPPGGSRGAPQSSLTSGFSTSTLAPANRPSRKVVLEPGHSPLDWAALTRNPPTTSFLRGADVPPHLIKVPPSEIKRRNGRKGRDAWGTYKGRVYNLTPYVKFHPGGVGEIMRGAGKVGEAERLFNEIHPWVNWDNMLGECLVGILVSEPEVREDNALDSLD